jgi:hypothetical protein
LQFVNVLSLDESKDAEVPMVEHDLDYLDELIQALSARAAESSGLDNVRLRTKLLQVFEEAKNTPLTFDYFTSITGAEVSAKEQNSRKISWVLQHALGAKVWCVNSKLLGVSNRKLYSPVVEQIKRIGIHHRADRLRAFQNQVSRHEYKLHTTVDAVLVSQDYKTLYVVKGCTISSLSGGQKNKPLRQSIGAGGVLLWDPTDRIIAEPVVDAEACRTLVLAWGMLKDSFNHMTVVPAYCIVDDFNAGWHFQLHSLEEPCWNQFKDSRVSLSSFPVVTSSLKFLDRFREDVDCFNTVPSWMTETPLYAAPPDRPARSLMNLDVLQREQAGNQREIVPVQAGHLGDEVSRKFDLFYTKDMRRHDLLHLTRRGLVAKHLGNSFTITPIGLARYHIALAMARGETGPDFAEKVLNRVYDQAALVWKNRNL